MLGRGDEEESSSPSGSKGPTEEARRAPSADDTDAPTVQTGEAVASGYQVGDKCQVSWKGKWYPATILAVGDNGTYKIHYDGWGSEWDEWVSPSRMRGGTGAAAAKPTVGVTRRVGDKCQVSWKGKWYPATILAVGNNGTYKIHYDGWGSEWDEWVSPARMR